MPSLSHRERFSRLTARLAEWQALWRPLPFRQPDPSWAGDWPQLADRLRALPESETRRLQQTPFVDSPLARWLPVAELATLTALPALPTGDVRLPARWGEHVGGRKWCQIEAFVPHVAPGPGQALVEWCAGKGHLARALARWHETEVTALEWQPALCDEGARLAASQGATVSLVHQDVLASDAGRWLSPVSHVSALHACGDLHDRLIELATVHGSALTLAPCCYHRTVADAYRPRSAAGRSLAAAHGLTLSREDLALAVQETVTAPRGDRRRRELGNAWRLGFDRLQREQRGVDAYLPMPSLAYGRLPATFAAFCRWAAAEKGLSLPANLDWDAYERAGWRRLAEVTRLELVRHLFRRPLEVWLVLDRLHRLEEGGLDVELGTFCPRELTPRNLLLQVRARSPSRLST